MLQVLHFDCDYYCCCTCDAHVIRYSKCVFRPLIPSLRPALFVCLFFCDSILNKYLIGMALLCVIVGALTSDAHVFVYFIAMHLKRQKKPNETGEHIKSVHVFNVFYLILFISLTVWCSKNWNGQRIRVCACVWVCVFQCPLPSSFAHAITHIAIRNKVNEWRKQVKERKNVEQESVARHNRIVNTLFKRTGCWFPSHLSFAHSSPSSLSIKCRNVWVPFFYFHFLLLERETKRKSCACSSSSFLTSILTQIAVTVGVDFVECVLCICCKHQPTTLRSLFLAMTFQLQCK